MTTPSADLVSVTSQHTVLCAHETSWRTLESPFPLGPLDSLVTPFIPVKVVFVYERPASPLDVELIPVERLQRALELLLDYYPHLTGRLQINLSDGSRTITRLGTGAELFVARCTERLDAFSSPPTPISPGRILMVNLPDAGNALMSPFDGTVEGVCRDPLFSVQHTRFACGGVALGVRLLHTVTDADGFFQLVQDLAELYRGVRSSETNKDLSSGIASLAHPPSIRPYMSELTGGMMSPEDRQAALEFKPSLFYVDPMADAENEAAADVSSAAVDAASSPTATASLPPPPSPITGRFMRFSSRELNAIKARATDPNGSASSSSDNWISTFDALAAHLYQRVIRARLQLRAKDPSVGEMSPPDFLTPVNLRTRLGLPPRYFPNALVTPYTSLPLDLLANGPLWQVAKAVHELTRGASTTSKEDMDRTLRWIAAQPDTRKINTGFRYGNGSFMISQWNKFNMYAGTVFEVPPVLVSTPFTEISLADGLAYTLPTEIQGAGGDPGAIDVAMSMSDPLWDLFDRDEYNV